MSRQLYLHIGTPKTGTTAIQRTLLENHDALLRLGVCYPYNFSPSSVRHHRHHEPIYPVLRSLGIIEKCPWDFSDIVGHYLKQGKDCQTFVVSDECIYNAPFRQLIEEKRDEYYDGEVRIYDETYPDTKAAVISRLCDELSEYFEAIKIVVYLRRQDHLFESLFLEDIKTYGCYKPIAEYDFHQYEYAYHENLELWSRKLGRDNVIVRVYERDQLHGDLVSDFCSAIGVDSAALAPEKQDTNRSYDLATAEYRRILNRHLREASQRALFRSIIDEYVNTPSRSVPRHYKQKNLISRSERVEFLAKHEEANQKIARDYLHREDGVLFYEPIPVSKEEIFEEYRRLRLEEYMDINAAVLAALGARLLNQDSRTPRGMRRTAGAVRRALSSRLKGAMRSICRPGN